MIQPGLELGRQRARWATILGDNVNLFLAAAVADEGDLLAVRRPRCLAIMGVAALGQVAGDTKFDRQSEHVAASRREHAFAVRRDTEVLDLVPDLDPTRHGAYAIIRHPNLELALAVTAGVVQSDPATDLVDDAAGAVSSGPLDIPVRVLGELAVRAAGLVIAEQVQRAILVGDIEQAGLEPNRIALGADMVGDLDRLVALEVEDEQVLCPAALVTLPAAEIAEQRRVKNLVAVG